MTEKVLHDAGAGESGAAKTVLVTGASGGIGGAIAAAFARAGHRVVLGCHRGADRAAALQETLAAEGCRTLALQADVADPAQVDRLFAGAEAAFGPVEVLVNAAGHAQQKLFTDLTGADWAAMLAVHATGTFNCCRRAVPAMVRAKGGCIVNIASMWGQVGASCEVHYSAAKAAVIGLTRALAKELGPSGVRVNAVAPGAVATAMMAGFTAGEVAALCEDIPLGRLGRPEEVAAAVLFLAGEGAAYLTGQVLAPNGGLVV